MTEIEKMKRYIERTKMEKGHLYQINMREMLDLAHTAAETPIDVVCLAFECGKAKGYRAAQAERRAVV